MFGGEADHNGWGAYELSNGEIVSVAEYLPDPTTIGWMTRWYHTSADGELLTEKDIFGFGFAYPRKLLMLSDQRFLIAGSSARISDARNRPYLTEVNAEGEEQWKYMYEYLGVDSSTNPLGEALDVDRMPDGGYLVTAFVTQAFPLSRSITLIRTDEVGNPVWVQRNMGLGLVDRGRSAVDNEGNIYSFISSFKRPGTPHWLTLQKRTAQGDLIWEKDFAYLIPDLRVTDFILNHANELVVVGNFASGAHANQAVILQYSPEGNFLQERLLVVDGWSSTNISSVIQTQDRGYLFVGALSDPTNNQFPFPPMDMWIRKTHPQWGLEWEKIFGIGANNMDVLHSVVESRTGGAIACGTSTFFWEAIGNEVVLLKVGPDGDTLGIAAPYAELDWQIFPNPAQEIAYLWARDGEEWLTGDAPVTILVYDMLGREIFLPTQVQNGKLALDVSRIAAGIYTVRLSVQGRVIGQAKVLKQN
ncbi:MAG: T9SS type A sorting domain-containing protein [Bacteroidota bacterium]